MIPMVDTRAQYAALAEEINTAVCEVLASGSYIQGPQVRAFEREAAAYLGAEYAVSVASGTDALHLALRAAGVGPGDEVVTTPFTFAATAEAIYHVGARPVYVDVDPDTFNLDPAGLEAALGPATRAILPVHLFGLPVDMEPVLELARRRDLRVIEDCAQAFGARCGGRPVGTFGIAGCFSFYPTKNLGACGDGGMVVTSSQAIAEQLRLLRDHGATRRSHHDVVGYNSRLDEIQAALLRIKLRHIDAYNAARREVARSYERRLRRFDVVTPREIPSCHHVYHQYTIRTARRDAVRQCLTDAEIASMIYYPKPLYRQGFHHDDRPPPLPHVEQTSAECLSLPIYPELRDEQIAHVVRAVAAGCGRCETEPADASRRGP